MRNFSKDVVHISQIKLSFFPEKLFYLSFHRTTSYTPRAHRHRPTPSMETYTRITPEALATIDVNVREALEARIRKVLSTPPGDRTPEGWALLDEHAAVVAHVKQKQLLKHAPFMPLKQAAAKIGIGQTQAKTMCRNIGLEKWPWRQIQAVKDLAKASTICTLDERLFITDAVKNVSIEFSLDMLDYISSIWPRVKNIKLKYRRFIDPERRRRQRSMARLGGRVRYSKVCEDLRWCSKRKRSSLKDTDSELSLSSSEQQESDAVIYSDSELSLSSSEQRESDTETDIEVEEIDLYCHETIPASYQKYNLEWDDSLELDLAEWWDDVLHFSDEFNTGPVDFIENLVFDL